jgi:hypothetical protein
MSGLLVDPPVLNKVPCLNEVSCLHFAQRLNH